MPKYRSRATVGTPATPAAFGAPGPAAAPGAPVLAGALEALRDLEEVQREMGLAQGRITRTRLVTESHDKLVSVALTGDGRMTGLELAPDLFDLPHDEVGNTITRTVEAAFRAAADYQKNQLLPLQSRVESIREGLAQHQLTGQ